MSEWVAVMSGGFGATVTLGATVGVSAAVDVFAGAREGACVATGELVGVLVESDVGSGCVGMTTPVSPTVWRDTTRIADIAMPTANVLAAHSATMVGTPRCHVGPRGLDPRRFVTEIVTCLKNP
ncbi:MAG: hypothetical protein JWP55_1833 [Mycobacterium sp.]|nr:hypothetical protein [Mycobacterium sp.]